MIFKTVLAFTVLYVTVDATPLQLKSTSPLELVSIIELEEPCVRQGGICVRVEECDPGNMVQMRGVLCPTQRDMGVECCYV